MLSHWYLCTDCVNCVYVVKYHKIQHKINIFSKIGINLTVHKIIQSGQYTTRGPLFFEIPTST